MINGIFGKKKRLWGDEPNQWDIKEMPTGSGAGMPGPEAMGQQPQPKGPSFLNRGLDFASGVADTMIQLRGGPPTHSLMKQRLAQQQFAEAQYERKRTDDFADWTRQQQFKIDNPEPTAYQRDLRASGMDPNSPEAQELYQRKNRNAATAPPIVATNSDGTKTIYPAGAVPRGNSGPTPGMVEDGYRFKGGDPADKNNWEPVGGGVGNNVGGFPGK